MNTVLLLIDLQERLVPAMSGADRLVERCERLLKCAVELEIPALITEHVPDKLGPTVPSFRPYQDYVTTLSKTTFDAMADPGVSDVMDHYSGSHVILAGIEAHVCVFQTARSLVENGHSVDVIWDAVDSRHSEDKDAAKIRLVQEKCKISTTEMWAMDVLKTPEHPKFKLFLESIK